MDFFNDPKIPLFAGVAGALLLAFTAFLNFFVQLFGIFPGGFFYGFISFINLIGFVLLLASFGLKLFALFKK